MVNVVLPATGRRQSSNTPQKYAQAPGDDSLSDGEARLLHPNPGPPGYSFKSPIAQSPAYDPPPSQTAPPAGANVNLSTYARYAESHLPLVRNPPPEDYSIDSYNELSMFFVRLISLTALFAWAFTLAGLLAMWLWFDRREKYKWCRELLTQTL